MFDSLKKVFSSPEAGEKAELEKKLKAHPNDAQTRQRLALILLRDRQVKEGLVHLSKVAEGYEGTGFDSKAVAVWRQYLKYDPDDPEANRRLVAVLARQGLAGDARNELEKAAPRLRAKMGDDAFVEYCRSAGKALPASATPELLACDVLLSRKNVVEVLSFLTGCIERALAAPGERGAFAETLSRFAAACASRTDFSAQIGFMWLRLGEREKAVPHLERALASLRAAADPGAAPAERVLQAIREGKDPSGKGVFTFEDAAVCLAAFFPAGEGIDIVVEGGEAPPPPAAAPAAPAPAPAAPSPAAPPPPPSPTAAIDAMGEEERGMVQAAFGRLHARVEEEIGESDLEARYNLGIAYKEMGLLDEAVQEFSTARKRRDLAFSCAVHLAEIQAAKGDFDASLAELEALIVSSTPGSMELFDLRYQKADVLEAAGRPAEAGEIFRSLLKENPNYRDVRARAERHRA